MAASCCDFGNALGGFLALYAGEIRAAPGWFGFGALRRGQDDLAFQMGDQRQQIGRGQHIHLASPGGFGALGGRADQPLFARCSMQGREQHAGHCLDGAIKAEFANRDKFIERILGNHPHRAEQPQRDRQIIMRSFLGQIGWRQVHHHPARRQRKSDGVKRGGDALAAFLHRLVGQAHGNEGDGPGRDLHLHINTAGFQPQKRHRADMDHHQPFPQKKGSI